MSKPGYVYVLRLHVDDNQYKCPYKIGRTRRPADRYMQLGILMPYETSMVAVIQTDDMEWAEETLHHCFDTFEQRMNGEWFWLDEGDLTWLVKISCSGMQYGMFDSYRADHDLPF